MNKKWYCYLCGKIVKKEYYLFSMRISTDRVFICCSSDKCLDVLNTNEDDDIIIKVKETEDKR